MRGFLAKEVPTNDEVNTVLYRRAIRTVDDDVIDETQPITEQVTRTTGTKSTVRCPYIRFPRWCFWLWLLLLLALLATVLGVGIGLGTRRKSIFESCSSQSICMNNGVCTNGYCLCSAGYWYDSASGLCVSEVGIGRRCSANNQCFTNALCPSGVCRCITNYYPSPTNGRCYAEKTYGQPCTYDLECAFSFECISSVCTCNSTKYYSTLTSQCEKLGEPNQDTCYADYNCIATAVCIGGVCRCPTNWYYDVFTDTCDRARHIGQVCTVSYQCMSNSNCTLVIGVLRCQCISGTRYSVIYAACITPISYNRSCLATADCASNFVCTNVNGASYCLCGTDTRYYYALNATCLDKALYSQTCSALGPYCDDGRLLQCSSFGNCTCPSTYYYSTLTSRCEARIYPGNACTTTPSCIANANCTASICKCFVGADYFDVTTGQCVALKPYGIACTEQEQCRTGLYCISSICQCYSTQYYNATSTTCANSATNNAACNSATGLYCNTVVGLYCSSATSTCLCPTNYYWNGTKCIQKNYLYDSCTAPAQCPTNALCSASICQCTSATSYYKVTSNSCVVYSTYGQTCVANLFVADECSPTSNLVCSSTTSGLCQCKSGFYNSGGGTCAAKSSNGVACTMSSTCNDLLGLICVSAACGCATGTYWNGALCVETLGVGQPCGSTACTSPSTCMTTCQCLGVYYLDWITARCLPKKASASSCSYGLQPSMAEETKDHNVLLEPMYSTDFEDRVISADDLTTIFSYSNDMAKQIKEQVMNTLEHLFDLTS